jgi:opacity protein-like surface antigen
MHPIPVILAALAVPSLAATATAQTQPQYQPAEKGTWYLAGGSSALFESVDGGDYGDTDSLGFSVSGGRFVADGLLLRGMVEWTSATEESGNLELDEETYTLAAGLRYYFSQRNAVRPYLGIAAGIESLDEEIDNGAMGVLSDDDSYPVYQGELGLEVMISRSLGIDIGLVGRKAMDVELFGIEDDLTSFGLVVGLSAWL